jgi:L-iditol 2-dehydrogenase
MKAAILEAQRVMSYTEVPTPTPLPGNVRIQVKATSICGSDIKRYKSGHRLYPIILGHECGGVVDEVGKGVDRGLIGKHVSVVPLVPCFSCIECERGHYSACLNYSFIGSRQSGSFADYLELPENNILVVPDQLPFEHVAMIEPSTVARHMVARGDFMAGETALVFGVGSIGLLVVQWLRILKAKLIIAVDISEENLQTSQKLGAHVTLNMSRDDVVSEVRKLTGNGVDLSFEAAGVPQTLEKTIPVTRPRGRVVLAGNQPIDKSIPLSFIEDLIRRELSVRGSHMSFSSPFPGHEWTDTVAALEDKSLDMDTLITHRFSLSEAPEVFAKIGDGSLKFCKIMLQPEPAKQ